MLNFYTFTIWVMTLQKIFYKQWDRVWRLIFTWIEFKKWLERWWTRKCDCWQTKDIRRKSIYWWLTKSCWKCICGVDYTWKVYNRLLMVSFSHIKNGDTFWNTKCSCWQEKKIRIQDIVYWKIKSCWCLHSESARKRMFKHWMSKTRFNNIYDWILYRCNNNNCWAYYLYWWRWIKCEWKSFEEFRDDMYKPYLKHIEEFWEKNTTIDRIDVNWNYCKENCRWETIKEQTNNRINNIYIEYNWEKQTLSYWCKLFWLKYMSTYHNIKKWKSLYLILIEKWKD